MRVLTTIGSALAIAASACAPAATRFTQLAPVPAAHVVTMAQLLESADSAMRSQAPRNADRILIVASDSLIAAVSVYELKDIFWIEIYAYNNTSRPFLLNPSALVLMDGSRLMFRQLAPHEAANIYLGQITGIPPYQPKYTYDVQVASQGYARTYGNYTYYQGQAQATVTPRENPYYAMGYNLGAAIAADRNRRLQGLANTIYAAGLVESSQIPAKTGAYGGAYWLKRRDWKPPLILRLVETGYEVTFSAVRR